MILSRYNLKNISAQDIETPADTVFDLPEKVLQFGTGVLLRGLPDYFIDKRTCDLSNHRCLSWIMSNRGFDYLGTIRAVALNMGKSNS